MWSSSFFCLKWFRNNSAAALPRSTTHIYSLFVSSSDVSSQSSRSVNSQVNLGMWVCISYVNKKNGSRWRGGWEASITGYRMGKMGLSASLNRRKQHILLGFGSHLRLTSGLVSRPSVGHNTMPQHPQTFTWLSDATNQQMVCRPFTYKVFVVLCFFVVFFFGVYDKYRLAEFQGEHEM